jgi:type I restriction enzyme S subunit
VWISEVFEIQLGKMLNKLAKVGKFSAPYLGNRAVQWDFVDMSAIEVMDFNASEREKFALLPADLLVCEGGDVGRTAMWRGESDGCYYQKAIHRLRPKSDNALPAFMLRFMRFARDNGYFREFTSQSSIAHLTQEKLGSIRASNKRSLVAGGGDSSSSGCSRARATPHGSRATVHTEGAGAETGVTRRWCAR